MGGDPLLLSFIVVIIGGLGSLRGTVVAALLIGLSDGIISVFFSPDARQDPRHPPRRPGPRLPPAGPLRTAAPRDAADRGPRRCTSPCSPALARARPSLLPRLPRHQPRPHHGAGGLRHGLQPRLRLHRPALASATRSSSPPASTPPASSSRAPASPPPPALLAGLAAGGASPLARRPPRAPHHRRRLHDRDADVRPGRLPRHPLLRRRHPRRRGLRPRPRRPRPRPARPLRRRPALLRSPSRSSPPASSPASRWSAPPPAACSSPSARTPSAPACSATTPSATACSRSPLSGLYAGAAGAAYGLLFGYVGATFASIQYSILPLLWVLLGGAGTVLGPLVGTALMFYLVDLASRVTDATLLVVGLALLAPRPLRPARPPRHAARDAPCHGCRDACSRPAASPATSAACTPSRTSTSTSPPARSTR